MFASPATQLKGFEQGLCSRWDHVSISRNFIKQLHSKWIFIKTKSIKILLAFSLKTVVKVSLKIFENYKKNEHKAVKYKKQRQRCLNLSHLNAEQRPGRDILSKKMCLRVSNVNLEYICWACCWWLCVFSQDWSEQCCKIELMRGIQIIQIPSENLVTSHTREYLGFTNTMSTNKIIKKKSKFTRSIVKSNLSWVGHKVLKKWFRYILQASFTLIRNTC